MHGLSVPGIGYRGRPPRPSEGRRLSLTLASLLVLAACAGVTPFDPASYQTAADLKAESLALIDHAAEPAGNHAGDIDALQQKLLEAYEYEVQKGPGNALTAEQWKLLVNPDGALLGGFLKRWRARDDGFSPAFVESVKRQVGQAFDEIMRLENNKVRP